MGKSTAKGTRYETADRIRLKGTNDYGDFINIPLLVEAKWRKTSRTWRVAQWVETAMLKRSRRNSNPRTGWAVVFAEDKRQGLPIDLIVMPFQDWLDIMDCSEDEREWKRREG